MDDWKEKWWIDDITQRICAPVLHPEFGLEDMSWPDSEKVIIVVKDFKQIKLSQGLFALVDVEDFEKLNQYKWYVSFGSHSGVKPYARRYEKGRSFSMHRQILNCPIGLVVDHLNDNSS